MFELLESIRRKYHLNLGEEGFSPVVEVSTALSLSYREVVAEKNAPLIIGFPEKNNASTWLSVSLLINFFFEDYINQLGIQEVSTLKRNERVEIFGVAAQIESINNLKIFLKFSDQGGIPVSKKYWPQITKSNKSASNKFKLYAKRLKEFKQQRNAISRILEPVDSVQINQNYLSSKVLLITGSSNARYLRECFEERSIYGETLESLFLANKNIIIRKDLENFKSVFNTNANQNETFFKSVLSDFLLKRDEINQDLRENLEKNLQTNRFLTQDFKADLDDLVESYTSTFPELVNIAALYPGIKESLPRNLKAVIINEIKQVELYRDTIEGFLREKIPVIIVVDRHFNDVSDLNFFKDFIAKWPSALRFNWSRKKLKVFTSDISDEKKFLDIDLLTDCINFSNQSVKINISGKENLDNAFLETQTVIGALNEFELLQRVYYSCLYPAFFIYKNSYFKPEIVTKLANQFDEIFKKVKNTLPNLQQASFQTVINSLRFDQVNSKGNFECSDAYVNRFNLTTGENILIPGDCKELRLPSKSIKKILFTGFPFNEIYSNHLADSLFSYFIPDIEIKCWPKEGELTYAYIKRRLIAGYFTDNFSGLLDLPKEILLQDHNDWDRELEEWLKFNKPAESSVIKLKDQQDEIAKSISAIKFKRYASVSGSSDSSRVKCDILNFKDGSFLFLPKNTKVLAQVENDDLKARVKSLLFSELLIGSKIFKYKKDKDDFRELLKNNNAVKKAFSELELWKTLLKKLFESCENDISQLEALLMATKNREKLSGNPSRGNIHRWLYDPEIIAPELENIKIILLAANVDNYESKLQSIGKAFTLVLGHILSLSSRIRRDILKRLEESKDENEDFELSIDQVEVKIQSRMISRLEKSDIEIEYNNTRQILN